MIDHNRLDAKLQARNCPISLRQLISGLMFQTQESRILINDDITDWFPRSRGVLQGSPLSPWLFNLFIDDLLVEVNKGALGIPICFFYADDGVVIPESETEIQSKLMIIERWTKRNALFLNPKKCAIVTAMSALGPLLIYNEEVPQQALVNYLGVPICAKGMDFKLHLQQRIHAAIGRTRWLGIQSDSWGPAHRLRIYKQFLAPMFEYGAPLVWAWAQEYQEEFYQATTEWKTLMGWITNTSSRRYLLTANLCGLSTLEGRFTHLRASYQLILDNMEEKSPLKQLLAQSQLRHSSTLSFINNLQTDDTLTQFKNLHYIQPISKASLSIFLRERLQQAIDFEAHKAHLTSIIPFISRQVPGLRFADISLSASVYAQDLLFKYRRGQLLFGMKCICGKLFQRGHEETCHALKISCQLSRQDREKKREMKSSLLLLAAPNLLISIIY